VTDAIWRSAFAVALVVLVGCASGSREPAPVYTGGADNTVGAAAPRRGKAEQACLRAVAREAGSRDTVLLDATRSPEGTEVLVGVGPQRAHWRCIGYDDGTTTVVMSVAEERRL